MSQMPTPREESEALMNDLLPLAKRMLEEHGEFFPYAGFMRPGGEIVHVGGKIEGTERPGSESLIELLRSRLMANVLSGCCKATAIIFDVRVTPPGEVEKSDAIQVCVDHAAGFSAEVFLPYSISDASRLTFGQMFAQKGDGRMFGNASSETL